MEGDYCEVWGCQGAKDLPKKTKTFQTHIHNDWNKWKKQNMSSCNIIPPLRKAGVTVGDKGCTLQQKLVLGGLMLALAKTPKHQIRRSHMHGWWRDPSMPPPTSPKKTLWFFFSPSSVAVKDCVLCVMWRTTSVSMNWLRETDGGRQTEGLPLSYGTKGHSLST